MHMTEEMEKKFDLVSSKVLVNHSDILENKHQKQLEQILNPFKEKISDFEKRVDSAYSTERAERNQLKGELSKLLELNLKMSQEAENLSRALTGDNKIAGNWGEFLLESILEKSGLRVGIEYSTQETLKSENGDILRPDVIINLPDGKHIIVDSKLSLIAYQNYINSKELTAQETFAKQHFDSLKRHIDGLSSKKYSSANGMLSPDFVIAFIPLEPAFALAMRVKPDLLDYAWEKKIALVSPTTLLTTLKTVASLWKTERQEKNALEIAKRGGALYDKFALFVDDLNDLGAQISKLQKNHEQLVAKLSEGNGNILRQVEMLKELGAKTEKNIKLTTLDT
jgi:DNA recombination protein RmuC